ncbi:MAG: hypothetical protein M0Q90_01575 [Bacteroidales bacterium]|nr:hypothetical protein [Bacteroidales bacterium]
MKALTHSTIDRQNILDNRFALEKIQEYIGLTGMLFEGEYKFTTQMVADFYGVRSVFVSPNPKGFLKPLGFKKPTKPQKPTKRKSTRKPQHHG